MNRDIVFIKSLFVPGEFVGLFESARIILIKRDRLFCLVVDMGDIFGIIGDVHGNFVE